MEIIMKNQNIELPIILQKDVTSLFQYSLPLCAILAYPHMKSWYMNKYLDITGKLCSNKTVWFWTYDSVDYIEENASNKIFNFEFYDLSFSKSIRSLHSFILDAFNSSKYLIIFCDEFYIPTSAHYNKNHFVHEYLIYGYNTFTCSLSCIGFNKKGIYSTLKINIVNFNNAFLSALTEYPTNNPIINKKAIISFKVPSETADQKYNNTFQIKDKLNKYSLSSIDKNEIQMSPVYKIPLTPNEQVIYGIDTYKLLIYDIKSLEYTSHDVDLRTFLLLAEIKKSVLLRLLYLQYKIPKLLPLIQTYKKEVNNKFEMLKLYFIKTAKSTNDNRFLINFDESTNKIVNNFTNTITNIYLSEQYIIEKILMLL